jgi:hypothetical protein
LGLRLCLCVDLFRSGNVQALTNRMIATEGFDAQSCSCFVLARPTKSKLLFMQMVGRGLRASPGKINCLILDCGGLFAEHGLPTELMDFSLQGGVCKHNTEKLGRGNRPGPQKRENCLKKNFNHFLTVRKMCRERGYRLGTIQYRLRDRCGQGMLDRLSYDVKIWARAEDSSNGLLSLLRDTMNTYIEQENNKERGWGSENADTWVESWVLGHELASIFGCSGNRYSERPGRTLSVYSQSCMCHAFAVFATLSSATGCPPPGRPFHWNEPVSFARFIMFRQRNVHSRTPV